MVLKRISFDSLDDMYAAIGYGGLTATKAVGRVRDELTKRQPQYDAEGAVLPRQTAAAAPGADAPGVIVEDIGSCPIKYSRCCTPVPGDDIIGFITKGYGVSVHRRDCPEREKRLRSRTAGPLGAGALGGAAGGDLRHRAGPPRPTTATA